MKSKTFSPVLVDAVVGASATTQPVCKLFTMYTADRLRVEIVASGVTAGAGITAIFQDSNDGIAWVSGKTVAITTNATVSILINPETATDLAYLPFRAHGRVVITSGAGSAVTIDKLFIYQGI